MFTRFRLSSVQSVAMGLKINADKKDKKRCKILFVHIKVRSIRFYAGTHAVSLLLC